MKNSLELIQLGKNLSTSFVQDGKNLTEELTKIAEVHGLNKEQISRVAETANIETYLKLIQRSEDKYLDFPLADANSAFTAITKTASHDDSSDNEIEEGYEDIKTKREFSFAMYGLELEKTATTNNIPEQLLKADRLNGVLTYIDNHLTETSTEIARKYDEIVELTKQAMLSGEASFADVTSIIKVANLDDEDFLITNMKTYLSDLMPTQDFTKTASAEKEINLDSTLYKTVIAYKDKIDYFIKVAAAYVDYEQEFDDINTENKLGLTKQALWGKVLAAGTVAAAGTVGYIAGKKVNNPIGTKLNKIEALQAINQAKQLR